MARVKGNEEREEIPGGNGGTSKLKLTANSMNREIIEERKSQPNTGCIVWQNGKKSQPYAGCIVCQNADI